MYTKFFLVLGFNKKRRNLSTNLSYWTLSKMTGTSQTTVPEQKRLWRWQSSRSQLLDVIETLPRPQPQNPKLVRSHRVKCSSFSVLFWGIKSISCPLFKGESKNFKDTDRQKIISQDFLNSPSSQSTKKIHVCPLSLCLLINTSNMRSNYRALWKLHIFKVLISDFKTWLSALWFPRVSSCISFLPTISLMQASPKITSHV